jgi:hypothetical protein
MKRSKRLAQKKTFNPEDKNTIIKSKAVGLEVSLQIGMDV